MKKILFIEPAENHQDFFLRILKKESLLVTTIKHVYTAKISLFDNNNRPDLIIVGCSVSDANTFDLIKYIKSKPIYSKIKILKITPTQNKESATRYIDGGADGIVCLNKSIVDTFLLEVNFLLENTTSKTRNNVVALDSRTKQNDTTPLTATTASNPSKAPGKAPTITYSTPSDLAKQNNKITIINAKSAPVSWDSKLISSQDLEKKLKKAYGAKAIPYVVNELLDLTSSVNSDMKSLVHLIELDPALTAKVLKAANSSFYRGNKNKIYKLTDAVRTVGFNGLKDLVLSIGILETFSKKGSESSFNRMKFWYHTLTCGVIAREIAIMTHHPKPDSLFVCGLLHDMGHAIFDEYFPKEYEKVLKIAFDNKLPAKVAESKLLGIDHAEVAFSVLKNWGFPENILIPITHHNKSFNEILNLHYKEKQDILIIKLADCLAKIIGASLFNYENIEEIPNQVLASLKLKPNDLTEKLYTAKDITYELTQIMLLHVNPDDVQKCDDLYSHRSYQPKKMLLFSNEPQCYSYYEVMLSQLNYDVAVNRNMFSLPELTSFDSLILDFSDIKELSDSITFLKNVKKKYNDNSNVCAIFPEEMFNMLTGNKDIPSEFLYLIKPYSINNLIEVHEMLCSENSTEKQLVNGSSF